MGEPSDRAISSAGDAVWHLLRDNIDYGILPSEDLCERLVREVIATLNRIEKLESA